jgi:hypothetical protein
MEKSLKDLISRLPIPGLKESTNRHIIAELLTNELGIKIKPNKIVLKDEILTVSVPPVMKSALQIRQVQIIEKLNKEGLKVSSVR